LSVAATTNTLKPKTQLPEQNLIPKTQMRVLDTKGGGVYRGGASKHYMAWVPDHVTVLLDRAPRVLYDAPVARW
jgi:hypothetical protein